MKDHPSASRTSPPSPAKIAHWRKLFKRRLSLKAGPRDPSLEAQSEDLDLDSDKVSEGTNDNQNGLNYFDFTFV